MTVLILTKFHAVFSLNYLPKLHDSTLAFLLLFQILPLLQRRHYSILLAQNTQLHLFLNDDHQFFFHFDLTNVSLYNLFHLLKEWI